MLSLVLTAMALLFCRARRHYCPAAALLVGSTSGDAALAVIWALLWSLTDDLATHDVAGYAKIAQSVHLQSAREAARNQLLTLGAGLLAAGALFYTARNFTLARHQFEQSLRQFTDPASNPRRSP
jgi:hypothetical protein